MTGMYCKDIEPKPVLRLCTCWACALLIQSYPLQATADQARNEFQLPDISYSPTPLDEEQDLLEKTEDSLKYLEQQLKHYTRVQITPDSSFQLRRNGFRIKTQYRHDISTEFEAEDDGDVSISIKIPF
ncbi:MAG: hypothetical protein V7731_23265 [Amphritea sp.]